jgi:hypothetical protein
MSSPFFIRGYRGLFMRAVFRHPQQRRTLRVDSVYGLFNAEGAEQDVELAANQSIGTPLNLALPINA